MEGISTITYQGKKIYVIDFTNLGKSREETVGLIKAASDEFEKNPLNSVLALFDVSNAFFHFDTFKTFQQLEERCKQYRKKIAVVGLKGLQKTGFNTVVGSQKNSSIKAFKTQSEAKEWLAGD